MAKGLSSAAIFFATLTIGLILRLNYVPAAPPQSDWEGALMLLAAVLAPLLAVAGLLLAKRGGKPAPRFARVALAIAIGAFLWPVLILGPFLIGGGY